MKSNMYEKIRQSNTLNKFYKLKKVAADSKWCGFTSCNQLIFLDYFLSLYQLSLQSYFTYLALIVNFQCFANDISCLNKHFRERLFLTGYTTHKITLYC